MNKTTVVEATVATIYIGICVACIAFGIKQYKNGAEAAENSRKILEKLNEKIEKA